VRWKDKPVQLMPNELRLLRYLMEQPGHVFSRSN
jgi:two-component system phosphate regulon response regulator PhoB